MGFGEVGGGGLGQVQRGEERLLQCCDLGQAAELLPVRSLYRLLVNAPELFEQAGRRLLPVAGLEPHAHDPVEDQCDEADQRMGAYSLGQAVVDRADLDVGLEHPKASLDVGQALVALDHFGCRLGGVGHQQQLAVEQLEVALTVLVNGVAEGFGLQVDLDQVGQARVLDRVIEARLRARVRQRLAFAALAGVLFIELAAPLLA